MLKLWFSSVGSNAGLLLNIPPNMDGLFHKSDIKSLREVNKILSKGFETNIAEKTEISVNSDFNETYPVTNILS